MFKKGHERANPLNSPLVAWMSAKEDARRENELDTRIAYKWFAAKKATEWHAVKAINNGDIKAHPIH